MPENKSSALPIEHILVSRQDVSKKHSNTMCLSELAYSADAAMCLQCHKCTAGCPVSADMDFPPSQIVRLVQLNQQATLTAARSIWLCTSCHACATRCPSGVNPAALQDGLRRIAEMDACPVADSRAAAAATSFLWSVGKTGRANEVSLVRHFKVRTRTYFEMLFLGITMFFRGKLTLFKQKIRKPKLIAAIVQKHMSRGHSKD